MFKFSFIIGFLGLAISMMAQSPHGEDFKMDCVACHTPESWDIPWESWLEEPVELGDDVASNQPSRFDHDETEFALEGEHARTDCRLCHEDLVFTTTSTECISCHTDLHNMTVGSDCIRCHTVENWLVDNISELHEFEGFPLLGAHAQSNCLDCHISDSGLQFNRIGNDCINCHKEEYFAATEPNHVTAGFSMECLNCHDANGFDWSAAMNHDFFPLVKGHQIDCAQCHMGGDFDDLPRDCISCHRMDYQTTTEPDHIASNFSTDCASCHTLDIGWMPARYDDHDEYFPLLGAHRQVNCSECHNSTFTNTPTTCFGCHQEDYNATTMPDHMAVGFPTDCQQCHDENGWEPAFFDHNNTDFPLTGAHIPVDCNSCHANGFEGTPTDCAACHSMDFEQTTNPDHQQFGFSMDCASCHTTDPEWMPATFADHNNYYPLEGAHAFVSCMECHNETYTNTPTTCVGCHQQDYDNASNPNHVSAGFPDDCLDCHNVVAWQPANFDHDGEYFPIYSGNHNNEWTTCAECHTTPGNYALFSCIDCHEHNDPNDLADEHEDVPNYEFSSPKCFECHPLGE